jgi:hypothetical protein
VSNNKNYFVLAASCKLVDGPTRCVILDYERGEVFFISREYYDLIQKMDRKPIADIEKEIDEDSKPYFNEFMEFLTTHEIGFLTPHPEWFPVLDDALNDEYIRVKDVILELDENTFNEALFDKVCTQLTDLRVKDYELRMLSTFNLPFLEKVLARLHDTEANCIEVHLSHHDKLVNSELHYFIERQPLISRMFVYGAPRKGIAHVVNETDQIPVPLGEIFFVEYPFDEGNCCGLITRENLNFTGFHVHHTHQKRNGCLDRKLTIDRYGNIKNCPSLKVEYGNVEEVSIASVLNSAAFQQYWFIHKDQINICKVCEFRYNCTDCRAFLQDPADLYSKPLKCGYDPYTGKWEEQSRHPMKEKITKNFPASV